MIPTRLPSYRTCHYPVHTAVADQRLWLAASAAPSSSQSAAAAQPKPHGARYVGVAFSPYMARTFLQAGAFAHFPVTPAAPPSWSDHLVSLQARGVSTALGPSSPACIGSVHSHTNPHGAHLRPDMKQAPGQPSHGGTRAHAASQGGMTMAKFIAAGSGRGVVGYEPWPVGYEPWARAHSQQHHAHLGPWVPTVATRTPQVVRLQKAT